MATYRLGTISRYACRVSKSVFQNSNSIRFVATNPPKPKTSTLTLAFRGIALGGILGASWSGYSYLQETKQQATIINDKQELFFVDKLPNVQITRKIVNANNNFGLEIVLFQFQTCPFCCKVRSFLDYYGFSYSVVEVDAVLRQSIKWSPYKKVPILLVKTKDGRYVQLGESSMIVSALASFMNDNQQDMKQLAEYYPNMQSIDDKGKKQMDVLNKYFVMYQDNKPATSKESLM
jgi:microsomal prostaglandin-E synthase 2